ncbi:MAG: hypothetical protein A2588_03500 [Candidatus Veblenbacteria bacterium RIFOXYD1_FULL_43_11]|uniref:O-antigen ligase-related domain-containing protein n=1 Tax=Candidatus Veblenbacteria bacterium RIFOXYD1_FULL_43_11 TaxID=1802429 RepID=A0A1G2Q9E9_9BACT|nr:MAG: hypothetical protein A2588_03500 [Candidatus Veblenbacteria bacterium RIFOXYD1_FULL_43_11]
MWSKKIVQSSLFYLLIFSLPWQTRYIFYDPTLFGGVWEYGRLSLYGWDIVLALLVIISWPLIRQEIKNQKSKIKNSTRSAIIYLLLLSLAFFSGLWAPEPLLVTYWALRLLEGGILWLVVRALKPKLSIIFSALASAGTIQALWGICQFSVQDIFANKWLGVAAHPVTQAGTSVLLNDGGRWLRAYGGQVHPNVLGGLLVITSLATVWLIVNSKIKNEKAKVALWLIYVIQLIGLFVAFSRAAWLALFFSLAISWWLNKNSRSLNRLVIVITAIGFIILGSILWQPTRSRLIGPSTSRLEQQAIEERVTSIKESRSLLEKTWWRGVGMGNYTKALAQYMPGLPAYRYQPVHNIFLLVLTELGIAGLGLALLFLWRRFKEYPQSLLVFLAPLAVTVWFDHYWWTSASMVLLFWLIMALPEATEPDS